MLDETFLAAMADQLRADQDRLTVRDAALQKHLRGEDGRHDADFGDRPNFTGNDEVIEALDGTARVELIRIRAALARIEAGTYGLCQRCGDDIPEGRLRALPSAPHCVTCAQDASRDR